MKTHLLPFLMMLSSAAFSQTQPSTAASIPLYGDAISLENAKKILGAAEAFAKSKQWPVAIAIVDTGGNLVAFEKMDNTQVGSIEVALAKAKTANNFKRPTKAMEDALAGGGAGLRVLSVPGALPLEGGEPIYANGKIIGGIGVSGMQSGQDAEVVKAALAVLK
jgi:uncharacterized protein GlcG (DUF336 family)